MRWLHKLSLRFRSLFRKGRVEHELSDELRFHFEKLIEEKVASGMDKEEARYAALRELGGEDQIKEECRDMRRVNYIENLIQDVRYGLRQLRRNPGFTSVAVLTLALGIGANTAIFSVVDAVLLRPEPYPHPSRLVAISSRNQQSDESGVSPAEVSDWRDQAQTLESLAGYTRWEFHTLTGIREPDEVWTSSVSPNLFDVLGIHAVLGRTFIANESRSAVFSFEYWRRHFSSDPTVVGKTVAIDGKPYLVIGIAPANLEFPASGAQMWIPFSFTAAEADDRENRSIDVVARLKADVTLQQAQAQMNTVAHRLAMQYPKTNVGWDIRVEPFHDPQVSDALRSAVLALLGAVFFVQLIVCANVAGMLLARGTARQGEMAIRGALGAGRWRLIRQLLVETLMLAGPSSIAGLVVASSGLHLILGMLPRYTNLDTHGVEQVTLSLPVLGFTVALTLLTAIVVGLLPAMRLSKLELDTSLKECGRGAGSSGPRMGLQRALIVSEVALALVLLVGAGLMIQSFDRLSSAPLGFNPDHVLAVRVPLVTFKYVQGPQAAKFYGEVLRRIQALPSVKSVGMANNLPFTGFTTTGVINLPPNSSGGAGGQMGFALRSISPGYFRSMGIQLKDGRDFTPSDNDSNAPCVRIVNEAMARRYWPGQRPVGMQLKGACPKQQPAMIVGMVADSKQESIDSQADPELFEPYAQHAFASFLVTFVIRTASDPLMLASAVRSAVWQVDRDQPVIEMRTMENVVLESIWRQRFSAFVLGIFAAIATLLAALGIYVILAYSINRRIHEIGIRSALGATRGDIMRLVVGEGLFLVLAGELAGVLVGLGVTRLLSSLLFGVRPADPRTFSAVALMLVAVGLFAIYFPARRAAKVDPMVALRYE